MVIETFIQMNRLSKILDIMHFIPATLITTDDDIEKADNFIE